uniref:Uncharacterized protein n=1 Tax=Romanomermis culicivorax TaxID=13658 RepID=A0A915ILZ7_ROMCU
MTMHNGGCRTKYESALTLQDPSKRFDTLFTLGASCNIEFPSLSHCFNPPFRIYTLSKPKYLNVNQTLAAMEKLGNCMLLSYTTIWSLLDINSSLSSVLESDNPKNFPVLNAGLRIK